MLLLIKKITIKIVSVVVAATLIVSTFGVVIHHLYKSRYKISDRDFLSSHKHQYTQNVTEQRNNQNANPVSMYDAIKENNTSISSSKPNSPNQAILKYKVNDSIHSIRQDLDEATSQTNQLSLQDTSFIQTNLISLSSPSLGLKTKEDLTIPTQSNNLNEDSSPFNKSETQNSLSSKSDYETDSSKSNFEEDNSICEVKDEIYSKGDNSISENKSETSSESTGHSKHVQEGVIFESSSNSSIKDSKESNCNSTTIHHSQYAINNATENIDIDINKIISSDDSNSPDSTQMVNNNNVSYEYNESDTIKLNNYLNYCINVQAKVEDVLYDVLMLMFENDINHHLTTKEQIINHVVPLSSILKDFLTNNHIEPFENIDNFKMLIETTEHLIFQNYDYIISTFTNDNFNAINTLENTDIDINTLLPSGNFNNSNSTETINNNNFVDETKESENRKLNEFFNFCADNNFSPALTAIRQLQKAFAADVNTQRINSEHLFPFIKPLSTHLMGLQNTKFNSLKSIEDFKKFLRYADNWIAQNYDYIASNFTNNDSNINNESKELEINKLNECFNFCANNCSKTYYVASMQLFKMFKDDINNQRIDLDYFFLFINPLTNALNKFSNDSNIKPFENIEDFKTLLNYADNWIAQNYDYIVSNFTNDNNINDESNESEIHKLNTYFNFCINNNVEIHYIAYVQLFKMFPIDMSNKFLLYCSMLPFTTPLILYLQDCLEDYRMKPFENIDDFKALISYADKWISDHMQDISKNFTNNSNSSDQFHSNNDSDDSLDQLFIIPEESSDDNEHSPFLLSSHILMCENEIAEFKDTLDLQFEKMFGYSLYDKFHEIIVNTEYFIKPSSATVENLNKNFEVDFNGTLKSHFSVSDIACSRIYVALKKIIKEARIKNCDCKPLAQHLGTGIDKFLQDRPNETFKDVYEFQEFIETIDNSIDKMINDFILETIKNTAIY